MIHFNKITKYQSDILSNGSQIGTLELFANKYYLIEINYYNFHLPIKDKRFVKRMIENVHADNEKKKYKQIKRMVNFKPYSEFKIMQ